MRARTVAVAALLAATAIQVPGAVAATGGEGHRAPPSKRPYLNTHTSVVHDHNTKRRINVKGIATDFYTTAAGYAVLSEVGPRGVWWLTLYGKRHGREVIGRRITDGVHPRVIVSPKGRRIAYISMPSQRKRARLVVRRTRNGSLVRRHKLADPETRLLAYRKGHVWFGQDHQFAGRFNVRTGRVKRIRKGPGELVGANPTAGLAVRRDTQTYRSSVIELGGRPKVLWRVPEGRVVSWSPNDRYVLSYSTNLEAQTRVIAVRNARTGKLLRTVHYNWLSSPPRIAWLGSKAFLAARGGGRSARLVRYGIRNGAKVVAKYGIRDPDEVPWLPANPRP